MVPIITASLQLLFWVCVASAYQDLCPVDLSPFLIEMHASVCFVQSALHFSDYVYTLYAFSCP